MLNILLIDDSSIARQRVINILSDFNIEHTIINQVQDGLEALEVFNNSTTNLIITDLEMPNMDGLELISEIRKIDKSIYIIVISALINEQVQQSLRYKAYLDFIRKPIDKKIFKKILLKIEHHIS